MVQRGSYDLRQMIFRLIASLITEKFGVKEMMEMGEEVVAKEKPRQNESNIGRRRAIYRSIMTKLK